MCTVANVSAQASGGGNSGHGALASFIGLLHHSTGRSSASCGPRGRRGSRHRLHVHGLPTPSRHYTRSRSEEHTSELQSLMRISYAVFCLKKTHNKHTIPIPTNTHK